MREYLYGPDISITGLIANGQHVAFSNKSANFLNLTIGSGSGSCPYLLADLHGTWETYGKVLDKSNNQSLETSQTVSYSDFVSRFRLEERERELARIDEASLLYVLKDKSTVEVKAADPRLSARDHNYLDLSWGESFDLVFDAPQWLKAEDVIETRLTLTGYYQREANVAVRKASE